MLIKRMTLLLVATTLLGGCKPRLQTPNSVFLQLVKDKRSLLKMGFTDPISQVKDSIAQHSGVTDGNASGVSKDLPDNLLAKQIQDTGVAYTFEGDQLVGVQILINHANPATLFALLDSLGFKQAGVGRGQRQIFVNKEANIRYEMYLVQDQAIFMDRKADDGNNLNAR